MTTFDDLRAHAVRTGADCGRAAGDQLAAVLATADLSALTPLLADAWRLEAMHEHYARIKESELELIATGVDPEIAGTFRIAAGVALLLRLDMANVSVRAGGLAN